MSSFLRSVRRTRGKALELQSLTLPCPACGTLSMKRVRSSCALRDGTVVPDLERFQCRHCQANFFDDAAMRAIAEFRHRDSHKVREGSPRKRKPAARTAA
jgi:transposase-like protein